MNDPRILRTRAAVIDAAVDLVVEGGPTALTVDAVVTRSGVAKSTIYRHWPTRDDLLVGVFDACAPQFPEPPDDASFVEATRMYLHGIVRSMSEPRWSRMMPALLTLKAHEPGIASVEQHMKDRQDVIMRELIGRGIHEGRVRPDIDPAEAIALLVGPLVFVVLTGSMELTEGFADRALEAFLAGAAPSS